MVRARRVAFVMFVYVMLLSCTVHVRRVAFVYGSCTSCFFFFYEWEHRTGTMCPFSSLHPLKKGKEV